MFQLTDLCLRIERTVPRYFRLSDVSTVASSANPLDCSAAAQIRIRLIKEVSDKEWRSSEKGTNAGL